MKIPLPLYGSGGLNDLISAHTCPKSCLLHDVIVSSVTNLPRIYSSGNATPDNANGYPNGQAYCNSLDILLGGKITIEGPSYGTAKLNVNHP